MVVEAGSGVATEEAVWQVMQVMQCSCKWPDPLTLPNVAPVVLTPTHSHATGSQSKLFGLAELECLMESRPH